MATKLFLLPLTLVISALLFLIPTNNAQSAGNQKRVAEQKLLNDILNGYDKNIRAFNNESGPTIVNINFYVRSIDKLDEINMDTQMQLTFRMQWLDTRLAYQGKKDAEKFRYMSLPSTERIWTPDLFFSNEKSGHIHSLIKPNMYVRIFPDGEVLHSVRLTLKMSCPMLLKQFPFDSQNCSLRMASYGYTADDIIFKWKQVDPIQVTPNLHLPKWSLTEFTTDYCDSHTNTGTYSCIRADFNFSRYFRYYFISIFIPCIMLVIIGWLSLWLEHHGPGANGRLTVSLLTLLIMAVQVQQFNSHLPAISYTKAMDVWTGVCLTFVFSTLVQFVIANYLARKHIGCSPELNATKSHQRLIDGLRDWKNNLPDVLDNLMRIAYPIVFLLFVGIFSM